MDLKAELLEFLEELERIETQELREIILDGHGNSVGSGWAQGGLEMVRQIRSWVNEFGEDVPANE